MNVMLRLNYNKEVVEDVLRYTLNYVKSGIENEEGRHFSSPDPLVAKETGDFYRQIKDMPFGSIHK